MQQNWYLDKLRYAHIINETLRRRRKVRCNEIRPICSHCSRLNLECRWRPANSSILQSTGSGNISVGGRAARSSRASSNSRSLPIPVPPTNSSIQESFDDVFNYASFMWDGSDIWETQNWGHQELPMLDSAPPNPMTVSYQT